MIDDLKIRTSYFAKLRYLDSQYIPISIARFSPKWFNGLSYRDLAPSVDLLNRYKLGITSEKEYIEEFNQYLSTLNIDKIKFDLSKMIGDKIGVLLCYERSTDFCHRHLVSKWLSKELNISIKEL